MSKIKQKAAEEEVLEFKPAEPQGDAEVSIEGGAEKYTALQAQYIRLQADFENFKKRNMSTASTMYASGISDVIIEILPVMDYLDMAIMAQRDEEQRKGIELVKNAFTSALEKFGVSEMDPYEEQFDPNLHEAVMKVEVEGKSGLVVEVVKKGYQKDGKILRHPTVVVAE